MRPNQPRFFHIRSLLLLLVFSLVTACAGQPTVERVVITSEPQIIVATPTPNTTASEDQTPTSADTPDATEGTTTPPMTQDTFTTPHPILSDVRVRQAIAFCTDRTELINANYSFLTEEQRQSLMMDSFLTRDHWAYAKEGLTTYPFNPEKGRQLLEEAGWTAGGEDEPRTNATGDVLSLKLLSTDAQFRINWATVLQKQLMENCGIQLIRTHAPGAYVFGSRTGLQVRDFELGAYAWVGQADPSGLTLYACNQIPLPETNWEGQNYMGWCNEDASRAIIAANNTLDRNERIKQYGLVQREFTKDMVSLPLFNRLEAAAASNALQNFKADPTVDSYVANIDEWQRNDGGDSVVIGFTQEPSSLFLLTESAMVANTAASLLKVRVATSYSYDYQPAATNPLPSIENGKATNKNVAVKESDQVFNTDGEAVALKPGVEVIDANGELVQYKSGTVEMKQLTVTYEFTNGITWEDGQPVKKEDFELGYKIDCDPDGGAVSLTLCKSIQKVDFTSDTAYTVHYLPGAQWPTYFVPPWGQSASLFTIGAYPAHQVLSDGRKLADVPAKEWATLPEIARKPMSYGPYKLVSWEEGQRMIFEVNPHYYKGEPTIKTVIIQFFAESTQAVAQLKTGEIDVLGTETLGAGPELEEVLKAGEEGTIQAFPITSPTWEHVDMNLFIR